MSTSQIFFIKINDIIGKTWLASIEDSEGYVLSLKAIEQNTSLPESHGGKLPVSQEGELKENVIVTQINLPILEVVENSKNQKSQSFDSDSDSDSGIIRELYLGLYNYFKEKNTTFQSFIKEVNLKTAHLDISSIKYEELKTVNNRNKKENSSIDGKIKDLIKKLADENQLRTLKEIFETFKNST